MKRLFATIILLIANVISAYCQKQAHVWLFGDSLGLDFNSSPPKLLTNGKIYGDLFSGDSESAASIADETGRLLFYTDGVNVWNKENNVMPNGTGLLGSGTTTQTIIIPRPGTKTLYYVFTASPEADDNYFPFEDKGFRYSTIDLTLNGGLGDVTEKNILLEKSTTEKIAATLHANERDVWVVMHEWRSNVFQSYLVTEKGISRSPVRSAVGSVHEKKRYVGEIPYALDAIGQMKISPNGERLALALYQSKIAEIFGFNNETGRVSNPVKVDGFEDVNLLYGVEFSPNSQLLYLTDGTAFVFQIDIAQLPKIKKVIVGNTLPDVSNPNGLQLGPDGKIYVAQRDRDYIGAIHNPATQGEACGFDRYAISTTLNGTRFISNSGLPNFISSYFLNRELYPQKPYVEMPNVFTPNGDGLNDNFVPKNYFRVKSGVLEIYNRWGKSIYSTADPQTGWNGENESAGIYFWQFAYEGYDGRFYRQKGLVHLFSF